MSKSNDSEDTKRHQNGKVVPAFVERPHKPTPEPSKK